MCSIPTSSAFGERVRPCASSAIFPIISRPRCLFRLLTQRAAISDMYFMLQKEVVDRMAAQPGTKDYGRLTVMLAAAAEVEALFDVGPGAFQPRPKVWSAIVRLRPTEQPPLRHGPRRRAADPGDGGVLPPAQDPAQLLEGSAHCRRTSNPAASIRNCAPKRWRRRNSACWPPITLDWSAILEAAWPDTRRSWCFWICRKTASRSPLPHGIWRRTRMPRCSPCMSWNSCRSSPWVNR